METRLVAMIRGRRYFEVVQDGQNMFTGTLGECRRFARLHVEKELKSRRTRRRRQQPSVRAYRSWVRTAAV